MKATIRLVILVMVILIGAAQPARALDDGSPEAIVADTLVARPACFIATVLGSAFFVVSLPFSALSGSVGETADALVVKPAKATFTRPLGDYSSLK